MTVLQKRWSNDGFADCAPFLRERYDSAMRLLLCFSFALLGACSGDAFDVAGTGSEETSAVDDTSNNGDTSNSGDTAELEDGSVPDSSIPETGSNIDSAIADTGVKVDSAIADTGVKVDSAIADTGMKVDSAIVDTAPVLDTFVDCDKDKDGYKAMGAGCGGTDCDDTDEKAHPGAGFQPFTSAKVGGDWNCDGVVELEFPKFGLACKGSGTCSSRANMFESPSEVPCGSSANYVTLCVESEGICSTAGEGARTQRCR